jgi:hypothetical protein
LFWERERVGRGCIQAKVWGNLTSSSSCKQNNDFPFMKVSSLPLPLVLHMCVPHIPTHKKTQIHSLV